MDRFCLCERCIEAIRSRGEKVFVGEIVFDTSDLEYGEQERKCEWCEEVDDLYECIQ